MLGAGTMIFTETNAAGAFIIDLERREDDRGFFARMFCQNEFAEHGLKPTIAQANVAFNRVTGTLRGMHFQFPPAAETKLVRCTRGAILDIIVDLRPESPTYLQHIAVELNADNRRALYVPERFAHGYQALVDDTETSYSGRRVLHARGRGRHLTARSAARAQLAAAGRGHLGEGRALGAASTQIERRAAPENESVDMIIVDTALKAREAEGQPIRVGMVGAGFMGQGLTNQIVNSVPGMRVAAISNRQPERAVEVFRYVGPRAGAGRLAGGARGRRARGRRRVRDRRPVASSAASEHVDVICEVTGVGRVRRTGRARGLRARQARRADERRARRDDRPDPRGVRATSTA